MAHNTLEIFVEMINTYRVWTDDLGVQQRETIVNQPEISTNATTQIFITKETGSPGINYTRWRITAGKDPYAPYAPYNPNPNYVEPQLPDDCTKIRFINTNKFIKYVSMIKVARITNYEGFLSGASSLETFKWTSGVCNGVNFRDAWYRCISLEHFPMIDTSKGTDFGNTWGDCQSLLSFPNLDVSNGIDFHQSWFQNRKLTSFPNLDVSNGETFESTWRDCQRLKTIPNMNTIKGRNFANTFADCASLNCIGGYTVVQPDLPYSKTTPTTDMFLNTPVLYHPSVTEQEEVTSGVLSSLVPEYIWSYSC